MNMIFNPALLVAIPLFMAFVAAISKKMGKALLIVSVVLSLTVVFGIVAFTDIPMEYELGGFQAPFGICLVVDQFSAAGIIILNIIFALIVLMSFKEIGKYAAVLTVSLAALNGMILTGDLFNLFVFMEIAAIAAYIMTTMNKGYKHTFNYLVMGTLGSGLFLFGIILLYNIFGSLNIRDILSRLMTMSVYPGKTFVLSIVLIFAGISVEAKLMPFGGWVRGVLKKSNSLVGTLITSAYAFAILMVFMRLIGSMFALNKALYIAFTVITVATLVFAEASAFSKKNLREVLLFSSIAQSGLVVLLFLNSLYSAGFLVLVNNVVSKLVMFTIAGKMAKELGTDEVASLKGVFTKYILLGIGFTVAAMSLIGLPLFFGFIAKINALVILFEIGNFWLPAVILIMAVVEGAYYVRILTSLWNTGEEGELATKDKLAEFKLDGCIKVGITVGIIALVIIAFGVLPIANIKEFFRVDFMTFITNILGGM